MMTEPQTGPATTDGARPKVLRRPQQFSRKSDANGGVADKPLSATEDAPLTERSPGRRASDIAARAPVRAEPGWQEDSRFGMALILVVAVINLVLALLLPLMHKPAPERAPNTTMLGGTAAMPAPKTDRKSRVTVYTEPSNEGDRMDLNALDDEYNGFSTSPSDMPAPTARSIESDENF